MSLIILKIGGFNNKIEIHKKVCNNGIMKKIAFVLFALLSVSCFAYTKKELKAYPYKQTSFYGGSFSPDLQEKIRPFEGNAADYLMEFDNIYTYKNHNLSNTEKAVFDIYFKDLPQVLKDVVRDHVYAIYFVDGIDYGAMTDIIFGEDDQDYCIIYFNADIFYHTMDEWLTYRDNTLFKNTDDKNKVVVESGQDYIALVQTLTHEAAHVYDFINNVTPYTYDSSQATDPGNVFFSVWQDKYTPLKKYRNKKFEKASYYGFGGQVSISQGKNIVEYLAKTPFCTAYASKNWMDDFAEALTYYHLQKKYGIDYKITWYKNGKPKASYSYKDNPNAHVYDELCKEILGF